MRTGLDMARRLDLSGRVFGKWTAIERSPDSGYWKCRCTCGIENFIPVSNLTTGKSTACVKCGHKGDGNGARHAALRRNGEHAERSRTNEYLQAAACKSRAKIAGLAFGFASVSECAQWIRANTPTVCPVLGIPLIRGIGARHGFRNNAPSVDRVDSKNGYVSGNMQVISFRANAMKNDATQDELERFARWVLRG
jgi:hypothetical protein